MTGGNVETAGGLPPRSDAAFVPVSPVVVAPRRSWASGAHAALGMFPLAYFTLALVTDYAYSQSGVLQWQYFSIWLIVAGLVTGGLTVLAGLIDWGTGGARGRRGFGWHFGLSLIALIVAFINAFVHSRDGWVAVVPQGILLSLLTVLLLIAGGLIGHLVDRPRHYARTDATEVRS